MPPLNISETKNNLYPAPHMKRLFFSLLLTAASLLPFVASAEVIRDYRVTATVETSRNVIFEETITYDFTPLNKHGILRFIPEHYERHGASYRLRINVLGVTRDGKPEPFTQSEKSGDLQIKIGDPDESVTGLHVYTIRYETNRAINSFADHDELYWNVNGNGWPVGIEKTSFSFVPAPGTDPASVDSVCYTGERGSTEKLCSTTQTSQGFVTQASRVLGAYEGMTVAFSFPTGIVRELTLWEKAWILLRDNGVLAFPIVAFAVMFLLWRAKGRDPKTGTLIPQYEPPKGLSPAVIGSIMATGTVPAKATTATIVDLARRGFLKIRFDETKGLFGNTTTYTFVNLKKDSPPQSPADRAILYGLFVGGDEQTVTNLRDHKFYTSVESFRTHIQAEVDALRVFDTNPIMVRTAYAVVAVLVGVGLNILFSGDALGFIAGLLTGVIIFVFGWQMPRRTAVGTALLTNILGFKWFLSVTEKDRMSFHNAPERKPEQFQALLPYAIVFDVERQWTEQFASLNLPPPDWATGAAVTHMNMMAFTSSLDTLHSAASTSAYASPSSGGSGFSGGSSGGGGGGGGGGSW